MIKTLFTLSFLISFFLISAQDCKVLISELEGSYRGKCKKGLAHGKGLATGTDTYNGEFKKGLPDGEGKYTYANGNVYDGEFSKGVKDGKGVMTFQNDQVPAMDGYWMDDEFIGEEKNPYAVLDKSTSVRNVRFRRLSGDEDKITFKFTFNGKPVKSRSVNFECPDAVFVNSNDFEAVYSINNYPVQGNISFSASVFKEANGTNDWQSGQAEFKITFKGHWEVTTEVTTL